MWLNKVNCIFNGRIYYENVVNYKLLFLLLNGECGRKWGKGLR